MIAFFITMHYCIGEHGGFDALTVTLIIKVIYAVNYIPIRPFLH